MLGILGKSSSINVRKVLWTCAEIGLEYRHEPWDCGVRPTDTPEFLALNPNALVPVVRDGDFVLWESNSICRYLAAKHGRADLLPADRAGRAQAQILEGRLERMGAFVTGRTFTVADVVIGLLNE